VSGGWMQRFGENNKQWGEKANSDHTSGGTADRRPTSVFVFNFLLKTEKIRNLGKLMLHCGS
jgi:hypothetical protein